MPFFFIQTTLPSLPFNFKSYQTNLAPFTIVYIYTCGFGTPSILLSSTFIYHHIISKPALPLIMPNIAQQPITVNKSSSNTNKLAYLCAWQSLHDNIHRFMNFNPGGHPICIDSGASCSISNNKHDFIDLTKTTDTSLHGITSSLKIDRKGTLRWPITIDNGDTVDLYIRDSLYVSSAPMCLLSPQQLLQQNKNDNDGFTIQDTNGTLHFNGHVKTIYYNKRNNLPIFFSTPQFTSPLTCHP